MIPVAEVKRVTKVLLDAHLDEQDRKAQWNLYLLIGAIAINIAVIAEKLTDHSTQ